ncbi:hypothetical protein MMC30_008961 [Trapelia coarctata]|nr:hypothetical protein [Trapelia coarctata]
MSSNNPVKNFLAHTLDEYASPTISDVLMPETRKGCPHYESRVRKFVTSDGSYGGINKDNFKEHFNKDFKEKTTYDKRTNIGTGPTLQGEMRRFDKK